MWADGRISNEKQAEGDQEADQKCERWRTARRDEHPARAKDKDKRQPSQKEDGDESAYAGNRWNFGLIDARYDDVCHDDFAPFLVTCTLQVCRKCSILTFTMQVTHPKGKAKRIKPTTEARGFPRSPCAVSCTLDLVGDTSSLLVVRDLLHGHMTYSQPQNS